MAGIGIGRGAGGAGSGDVVRSLICATTWPVARESSFPEMGSGIGACAPWRAAFVSTVFTGTFKVSGVTKDSTGAILPNCRVHLIQTGNDYEEAETISDGAGAFSFTGLGWNVHYYLVAYKPGTPDVAGTTVNTVQPEPV